MTQAVVDQIKKGVATAFSGYASGGLVPPPQEVAGEYPTSFTLFGFHRSTGTWLNLLHIKNEEDVPDIMSALASRSPLKRKFRLMIIYEDFSAFKIIPAGITIKFNYMKGPSYGN